MLVKNEFPGTYNSQYGYIELLLIYFSSPEPKTLSELIGLDSSPSVHTSDMNISS